MDKQARIEELSKYLSDCFITYNSILDGTMYDKELFVCDNNGNEWELVGDDKDNYIGSIEGWLPKEIRVTAHELEELGCSIFIEEDETTGKEYIVVIV